MTEEAFFTFEKGKPPKRISKAQYERAMKNPLYVTYLPPPAKELNDGQPRQEAQHRKP